MIFKFKSQPDKHNFTGKMLTHLLTTQLHNYAPLFSQENLIFQQLAYFESIDNKVLET